MDIQINPENEWRTESPGHDGWSRSPWPDSPEKYFMVSADTHITPPAKLIADRIEPKYRDRLPRVEIGADGVPIIHIEGIRPMRINEAKLTGEDAYRAKAGSVGLEDESADVAKRLADQRRDGIDAEVVFPNGPAMGAYWTPDAEFAQAQFRVYNDWAAEVSAPHRARMLIVPCTGTADVAAAVAEIQRVARMGSTAISLPTHPIPGTTWTTKQYNHPDFDPLWAALQDTDLTMAFHVSTGGDPRTAFGLGGAIINRVRSHGKMADPIAALCGSGIFDRFPKLRFVSIEAGIGWIPSLLELMDETYSKHHMWIRPRLNHGLPSDYFRTYCAATFEEDRPGLYMMEEYDLADNFCWANDYPHHEGTFPHSAAAIEREMSHLTEDSRKKILGLNAARLFKFEVPADATT